MRRRDLAWLAVFPDPFARLSRPMSDVIGPTRVILENDDFSISRCGLERLAHAKDAHSDGVIGPFVLYFRNTQTLFHTWQGSSTPLEVLLLAEGNSQNHRGLIQGRVGRPRRWASGVDSPPQIVNALSQVVRFDHRRRRPQANCRGP